MVEIMVIALCSYLNCVCVSYCSAGFYFITKGKDTTLSEKLCICLLVPFYPIIFPFFVPYLFYCEAMAERDIREARRNDNRRGYDGFQERTDNIVNEDSNNTNIHENL